MDSLCGVVDCISCLKDGRFWLTLKNNKKCCIYNVATWNIPYDQLLQPGDESQCPAGHSSSILTGALGTLASLGIIVGVEAGVGCWIRSRRMERRLNLAEERMGRREKQARLLSTTRTEYPNIMYSVVNEIGEAGGSGNSGGAHSQRQAINLVQQQEQPDALYSARSRRSLAGLPYCLSDSDDDSSDNFVGSRRRDGQQQRKIDRNWRRASAAGAKLSRTKTTELGGKKVTEVFEMIPL